MTHQSSMEDQNMNIEDVQDAIIVSTEYLFSKSIIGLYDLFATVDCEKEIRQFQNINFTNAFKSPLVKERFDLNQTTHLDLFPWQRIFWSVKKYCAEANSNEIKGRMTSFELSEVKDVRRTADEFGRSADGYSGAEQEVGTDKRDRRTTLSLGRGLHTVRYKDEIISVLYHFYGEPQGTSWGVTLCFFITLFVDGVGKFDMLHKFVEHCLRWEEGYDEKTMKIYSPHETQPFWELMQTNPIRPLHSVLLPEKLKNSILKDIQDFLAPEAAAWYHQHGLPYKRSYLFYGPPGSGKTSFVQAIAAHIQRNIYFLQPINRSLTDLQFMKLVNKVPSRGILVIEDVDAIFNKWRGSNSFVTPISFSGFLNGLDGLGSSQEGQIVIMTTNFIDRLEPSMIRKGRVDMKVEFRPPNEQMFQNMFLNYYPGEEDLAKKFAKEVYEKSKGGRISMATLQYHFITHRTSTAKQCYEGVHTIEIDPPEVTEGMY